MLAELSASKKPKPGRKWLFESSLFWLALRDFYSKSVNP